jgi:mRNA deadenylase 3'-5' endonuclease subunit Ccr4
LNPDILCLQEVDSNSELFEFISLYGYKYEYRSKGTMGILTAYKSKTLSMDETIITNFDDHVPVEFNPKTYKTGHGMIIMRVHYRQYSLWTTVNGGY